MAEKSHPLGGQRTKGRHVAELGTGGALALLIVSFIPEGWMNAFQQNLSGVVLTGAFSTAAKLLHESGLMGRLLKLGMVLSVMVVLTGCAFSVGTVDPEITTGADGETIVACEMKGVQFGVFDGGVCRNVEGGQVGDTFVELVTGTVTAVIRAIAGGIAGFGGGIQAAAADTPVPSAPERGIPAITSEPAEDSGSLTGWFE